MFDHGVVTLTETLAEDDISSRSIPVCRQRTLGRAIACVGVGLHSGVRVAMTLNPAPVGSGIVFRRTDLPGSPAIRALWSSVGDTRLNTCLTDGKGAEVRTVEHLMAALAAKGVDNAVIDLDGGEVPAMDGSAAPFLFLIECVGTVAQASPRRGLKVLREVGVVEGDRRARLVPGRGGLELAIEVAFAQTVIGRQAFAGVFDETSFKSELSRARTFGFAQEVEAMQAAGLGRGGSLDNTVVVADDGSRVLNEDGLRYPDEFVRHKALDAVGDLYLAGMPIIGRFEGVRSGHALNNRLLRELFADPSAWRVVTLAEDRAAPGAASFLPRQAVAAPN